LSWSIVFFALGFALVGCIDIEPTKDEEIDRGLSKFFARNPAARIAASTSYAAEDPPLPLDAKN